MGRFGCGMEFCICFVLTVLGYIPGILYAAIMIGCEPPKRGARDLDVEGQEASWDGFGKVRLVASEALSHACFCRAHSLVPAGWQGDYRGFLWAVIESRECTCHAFRPIFIKVKSAMRLVHTGRLYSRKAFACERAMYYEKK